MRAIITIEQQVIKIETMYKILHLNPEYHLKNLIKNIKDGIIPPEYEYIFGTHAIVELVENNKRGRPPISKLTQPGKVYKLVKKFDSLNLDLHINKKRATSREIKGAHTLHNKIWNDFFDKIVFTKTPLKLFQGFEKTDYENYRLYRTLFLKRNNNINKMGATPDATYILINAFFMFTISILAENLSSTVDISSFVLNETGKFVVFFREFSENQINIKYLNSSFPSEEYLADLEKIKPNYLQKEITSYNPQTKIPKQKICEYKTMGEVDKILSNYSNEMFKELGGFKNNKLISSMESKYLKKSQTVWKNNVESFKEGPIKEDLRKKSREKHKYNDSNNDFEKKDYSVSDLRSSFKHFQTTNNFNNSIPNNNTSNGLKNDQSNVNEYNNFFKGTVFTSNMTRFGNLPPAQYDFTTKTPIQRNYPNNLNRNTVSQYNDINEYNFIPPTSFPSKRSIQRSVEPINNFQNNNVVPNPSIKNPSTKFDTSKPFYNKDTGNPPDNIFNYTPPVYNREYNFQDNISQLNKHGFNDHLNKKEDNMFKETVKPIKHKEHFVKNIMNDTKDTQGVPVYTPFRSYIKDDPLLTNTEQRMPDTFIEYMKQQEMKKENPIKSDREERQEEESTEALDMPVFLT